MFKQLGEAGFCDQIDEFCFILRVDGEISQWEFEGCENIDVDLKERYVSIDIGVPKEMWQSQDEDAIRAYLVGCMQDGLQMMVRALEEKNIQVNTQIFTELSSLLSEY
ncbi:hypothetical protein Maes01_02307 [Microbulbifer aestuariivivens]|uniref:Uncharacterized protein n=1 Tax=Microbulbifer aestuariivivens TaxID=1908308 RepID=A0ABP9WRL8_9GAMM